jgi:hypothetical protein
MYTLPSPPPIKTLVPEAKGMLIVINKTIKHGMTGGGCSVKIANLVATCNPDRFLIQGNLRKC